MPLAQVFRVTDYFLNAGMKMWETRPFIVPGTEWWTKVSGLQRNLSAKDLSLQCEFFLENEDNLLKLPCWNLRNKWAWEVSCTRYIKPEEKLSKILTCSLVHETRNLRTVWCSPYKNHDEGMSKRNSQEPMKLEVDEVWVDRNQDKGLQTAITNKPISDKSLSFW